MNLFEHQEYCESRAEIARGMAQHASNPLIAKVYEDLALRYDMAASLAAAISRRQATDRPATRN